MEMNKAPLGALFISCALVGSRTPNLLIRSQVLYPIELRVQSHFLRNKVVPESGCKDNSKNGMADAEFRSTR